MGQLVEFGSLSRSDEKMSSQNAAIAPHILADAIWAQIREARYEVAVLPWGATEAHNYHLPYQTDTLQARQVAAEAARLAAARGAQVIVLPAVPFGVQSGQRDVPFCLHVNPSTQALLLEDIARSVAAHGVRKLVILNGHGGNDFRAMVRELDGKLDLFICAVNWYASVDAQEYFDDPGDHAGELETSVLMHIAPDTVRPLAEAGDGAAKRFRIAGLREGWAWAPRRWTAISGDTGVGDPRHASADKGGRFFAAATEKIAGFLAELSAADPADMYD